MDLSVATMTKISCGQGGVMKAMAVASVCKSIEKKDRSGKFCKMLIRFTEIGEDPRGFWGTLSGSDQATVEQAAKHYKVGNAGLMKNIQFIEDKYVVGKVVNLNVSTKAGSRGCPPPRTEAMAPCNWRG